ncbi:fatty acyl-CoA reductase 3 [Dendrobium catenatum]|nr:fatty acyl-CoA reductase 3 [Dendrobium catenatum]
MEIGSIVEYLEEKSILVTGSTGFLAKIFVEKVLRVQPNVKKLFLLVRASDAKLATERFQNEVITKELFDVLKKKHGNDFDSFISKKVHPIKGDIIHENLGIEDYNLREMLWKEIDIVVNVAATTNFYERYDVALNINVLGAKHALEFAKQCTKLKMLLHVSTAYVAGVKEGVISEKPFCFGEALNKDLYLDIQGELKLVEERKKKLHEKNSTKDVEKVAMKDLGIERFEIPLNCRTIDSVILGYVKGEISCFLGDPEVILDLIPGDMVVNAMISAITAHSNQHSEFIYHVSSSVRNLVKYSTVEQCAYQYMKKNTQTGGDGKTIKTVRFQFMRTMSIFHRYMFLHYRLPLEGLRLINLALFGLFSQQFNKIWKKYKLVFRLADIYAPYAFYKGSFDDSNLERLRKAMMNSDEEKLFDFDPKHIEWDDYLINIHIPGVLKHLHK